MFKLSDGFGYFFCRFLFLYASIINLLIRLNLDPLDPLTEIINSGQGFSPAIASERIIWAMIGIFFLGAISRSITNSKQNQSWFGRNFLFSYSKDKKITDDSSSQPSSDEE